MLTVLVCWNFKKKKKKLRISSSYNEILSLHTVGSLLLKMKIARLLLSLVRGVSLWIILNHDSEAEVVKLKRELYRIFVFEMNRVHQKPASISYFYYFNELKNDGLGVLICCDVFRSPGKNGIRRKGLRLFPFLILFHNFCAAVNSEAR